MRKTGIKKSNIFLQLAGVLFLLIFLSLCLMPDLYARYITSSEGSDGARVARFKIDSEFEDKLEYKIKTTMKPGDADKLYKIEVINSSEVAVKCEIKVENEFGNLPLTLSLKKDGGAPVGETLSEDYTPESDESTYTYYLIVSWPTTSNDNYMYNGMLDNIIVSVHYEQID